MMKKLAVAILIAAACIMTASGAWAYTTTMSTILTDTLGDAQLDVGIWQPGDVGAPAYTLGGYWGYEYTIKNLDYSEPITDFAVKIPPSVLVDLVASPTGWTSIIFAGSSFKWSASSGYQLAAGASASGFIVKSTSGAYPALGTAWSSGQPYIMSGMTLGPGVPEPASAMLLGLGIIGFAGSVIRRKFMA